MQDQLDPDLPESDSFVAAIQGESFLGFHLQPWNPTRKIAAQAMGMLYPFIGDDGFEALERTGLYPGAQRDVIIFTWLRVQKDSDAFRAQRKPREAWQVAELWAESVGLIETSGDSFQKAYEIFTAKMTAVSELQGRPPGSENSTVGADLPKV